LELCTDLTSASHNQDSDKNFILAVQARLKRWQELLKLTQSKSMSREMQMGLFTELTCLKNILEPKIGIKWAIASIPAIIILWLLFVMFGGLLAGLTHI
jgi:hypothetical protein